MEDTEESPEGQVCDALRTTTLGFKLLDQPGEISTGELSDLKSLLHTLSATLEGVASKKASAWLEPWTKAALMFGHNPPDVAGDDPLSQIRRECYKRLLPACTCHPAADQILDTLRDELAGYMMVAIGSFWKNRPTDIEELGDTRRQLDITMRAFVKATVRANAKESSLGHEMRKSKKLESSLETVKGKLAEERRSMNDKYDELVKGYYDKVNKLVEGRVYDEKAKLAERLSKAEAKALLYDRVLDEKEVQRARALQGDQEKALLRRTKSELEKKYKDRDEEAKSFKEGYDQLSNDNQVLQTEKAVLQTDYDELKREYEKLSREQTSGPMPHHESQPAVSKPHIPNTVAVFARQVAELQHLDGLATIWQNTLDTATADVNDSKDKKKALEGKVQEAEQALKDLKPAPKSKPSRASSTKTGSEDIRAAEPAAVGGAWTGRAVVQSSVNPTVTLRKVPCVAEAFPALSSPAVPKTTPSTTWKSLRLVDTSKEEIRGAVKKSV
ncbi:uncharacterized protein J4E84_006608 [Alternaria hordeiaustralica]|uniref:uncharacterized protein n=1 Tax=Alternaria hordeiaustralica TaxID=1187925 RepID=UPI0020C385AB|nr:uncharacterized protein J4E84_006608 [Alternaria hordeiaustralica]KAI4683770.1 hypothetical protein J4E84_006608 [Alternaria hordeiaustralica]